MKVIHMGTSGIIQKNEDATVEVSSLIQTSKDSMQLERDLIIFQQDLNVILDNFESEDTNFNLAVRISGQVSTAYPEGNPAAEADTESAETALKDGSVNMVLVADTDILSDIFWVRTQSFLVLIFPSPLPTTVTLLLILWRIFPVIQI